MVGPLPARYLSVTGPVPHAAGAGRCGHGAAPEGCPVPRAPFFLFFFFSFLFFIFYYNQVGAGNEGDFFRYPYDSTFSRRACGVQLWRVQAL